MVLYKRKPVQMLPQPEVKEESQELWVISQTGEAFTDYQSYVDRLEFYKAKQFSCEITGHMNLNYFEALKSETEHSQDVEQQFPEPLKEPVLRKVQFSTVSRIDTLVDQLHDSFKSDFYPGEHVTAILPSGDRVEAVIREKTMFPELRFASGEIQRKGFSRYTVKMVNRNEEEAQIDNEHLIRDKKTFTKHMLRSFIKNTVSREPWTGAPWLVKEEFATKYKIPSNVPAHLQRATTAAERKAQQARRKQGSVGLSVEAMTNGSASPPGPVEIRPAPKSHKTLVKPEPTPPPPPPPPKPIKYPIEDLDLPPQETALRPKLHRLSSLTVACEPKDARASDSASPQSPKSNGIDEEKTAFYLSTWVFLNIYCEPFLLDSFTFDDYIQALQFSSDETDCELFVEIHCTLLKAIVNEQGVVQCQLPEPEEEEEEEEEEDEAGVENGDDAMQDTVRVNGGGTENGHVEARRSVEKDKKHRADELFPDGDSWVQLLKTRSFKNGGWQAIIVGLLYQLSWDSRYSKDTEDILAHLAPSDEQPTPETVKARYYTMNSNLRVMVIHLLSRLTHETRTVRDYMEECSEEMTKHRKEKIEHQRARKQFLEELKSLEDDRKILLPENTPRSPSPEPEVRQPSTDEDGDVKMGDDEEDEDEDGARVRRRGGERANERKRKRVEEKAKAEAAAKIPKTSKQFQKVIKSIETIKIKIAKEEEAIATIDEDLRQADCARFKMMGHDRFWNKYWWFERNGMPFGGLPDSSTAHSGYANAMIWVQGPEESERQGFLVEEAGTKAAAGDADGDIRMNGTVGDVISVLSRQAREENGTTLTSPTQYGFIETPEEFEQLMSWFDVRGVREKKLKATFETFKDKIVEGMHSRKKYLADSVAALENEAGSGRMTTRGKTYFDPNVWRCLNWKNESAREENDHTHYNHPQPRKAASKKKEPKGVPLNRQGKPVSRQGERYNF